MIANLKMIELEINSYCNRTCSWCPNSTIDRNKRERFPQELLIPLLCELKEKHFGRNWYGGFISFSRNNEPFADSSQLFKVAKLIREYLPYVNLVSNTNGDYLTVALESKVAELSIMDYDCKGYDYWHSLLLIHGASFDFRDGSLVYYHYKNKKVVVCLDWPQMTLLENRGGFFPGPIDGYQWRSEEPRRIGCEDPGMFVAIDYNGSVMPCCCLRSDFHTDYILGNLKDNSLEEILEGEKAVSFRKNAADPDSLPDACKYCHKGIGRYTRDNPGIRYSEVYLGRE